MITDKAIRRGSFTSVKQLVRRIAARIAYEFGIVPDFHRPCATRALEHMRHVVVVKRPV